MVPDDYKEVRKGVYESDAFITSRPVIDSARVQQILNSRRPLPQTSESAEEICNWNSKTVAQENEHSGA